MVLDFPYTVEDEPNEDWKVEQVLHWWLLRANAESEAEYDKIVRGLSKQLDEGKKALWQAHEEVSEILNSDLDAVDNNSSNVIRHQLNPSNANFTNNENSMPNQLSQSQKHPSSSDLFPMKAAATAVVTGAKSAALSSPTGFPSTSLSTKPNTIHIDIIAGDYQGTSYDLQPGARNHCWVGRSQGKKFRDKGISLPKDLEVSTTHGRFEYNRGNFYYMDTGSTNGSRIDGMDIEPNTPYQLKTGMLVTAGQTIMNVTMTIV